ncbi:MAG TPA: hypothetical protein VJN93_03020 [Candidatus Acidoferrum sp.]|nr:hypothetical protein [Candidatus Acidoferrum sp.]
MKLEKNLVRRAIAWGSLVLALIFTPSLGRAQGLTLPPGASAALEKIYSFDLDAGAADAQRLQMASPDHPLGYLLEADALWWNIWCSSAEYKYGMTDARRRPKLASDQRYLDLVARASAIARSRLKESDSAEMHFYAGLADAFAARLYGLRGENRATARAGVRARAQFLLALEADPKLVDADFGLGLYNYYADTLSAVAKILGFFMGIPGGDKQVGIQQLHDDIAGGVLTPDAARFYLALDLHRYDQKYEDALALISPLVAHYPSNPIFQLARGDLFGKLGRKEQAIACYRAAAAIPVQDLQCREHIQKLVQTSLSAQGATAHPSAP